MEDHEVEERLRRYRPAGPPPNTVRSVRLQADQGPDSRSVRLQADRDTELEADRGAGRGRMWWQLAAAVVLLIATLSLHVATGRIDRRIAVLTAPARAGDEKRLDDLARELGGDRTARAIAETILVRERVSERAALLTVEIPQ